MLAALSMSLLMLSLPPTSGPADFAYLPAGTPQVGGIQHLCLIYHGQKRRVAWTKEALLPYVAYVDEQGRPVDWLFDSFLLIEFATDAGASLYHYAEGRTQPTAADWEWLADCWFRETTGLIGLEQAVASAGEALRQPDRTVNVVITLPTPLRQLRDFGPLPGQERKLDFSVDADGQQALAWYIDRVLERFASRRYPHLRLVGFYWTAESVTEPEYAVVRWTSRYLHDKGHKFYWIPYFSAQGFEQWRENGFDAAMLQPNYFFSKELIADRFVKTAERAQAARSGVEMEFDERALTSPDFRRRFYDYCDAGAKYGWMNHTVVGWYEGGGAIKKCVETPGVGREIYSAVYRFVKGTYAPTPPPPPAP